MTADLAFAAPYSGTPVLVLGAGGFIGRWVMRRLALAGARLTLCVRDTAALESDAAAAGAVLVAADLLDHERLAQLVSDAEPVVCFNLAGYGVDPEERSQELASRTNAALPGWLAEVVSKTPAPGWTGARVVHVGSALEYGESTGDLSEDTPPEPTTTYGRSKLEGTRALAAACRELPLPGLTARLFTVYGPGEHAGRLLPSLVRAADTGEAIELTAGTQLRDFAYVEDVADGLLRLGLAALAPGQIVNLATGKLSSVRSFAECAGRLLEMPASQLRFGALPTRGEEMSHDPVSIARLRSATGWSPSDDVEAGLRQALRLGRAGRGI